jgi:hypothetical protein
MAHNALTKILILLTVTNVYSNQVDECSFPDRQHYYDVSLDQIYDLRRDAEFIAQALYKGPLMRDGQPWGIANLKRVLQRQRIRVRRIQEIVRGHLYGESDEFRDLLARLEEQHGLHEASRRLLESMCEAFDLTARSRDVAARDACLIANDKAHWVVTKMIVAFLELYRERRE